MKKNLGEHAKALASKGAAKGGRARANALSSEERTDIARKAAESRWGTSIPRATHEGELIIAGVPIKCAVLETGKRLLTQETFLKSIGRAPKAKGGTGSSLRLVDGLPPFLVANNLRPFISHELMESTTPFIFRSVKGVKGFGYDAILLPMVCEVYLTARDSGALLSSQKHIARTCELLTRGLARVGIIALVDEATGYQEQRARYELSRILEAYIAEELRPWVKTFPNEFFRQVYRLQGWEYKPGNAKRTPYVGKLINKYVYQQLPDGVLHDLRHRNPVTERGYRRHKHFQFLTTDTGHPHLDRQIASVTTLMRVSDDKDDFEENFDKAFAKEYQQRLPLTIDNKGRKIEK